MTKIIKGTVYNRTTKKPIAQAHVYAHTLDGKRIKRASGGDVGAVTNSKGEYIIYDYPTTAGVLLSASHVGYYEQTNSPLASQNVIDFNLEEDVYEFPEASVKDKAEQPNSAPNKQKASSSSLFWLLLAALGFMAVTNKSKKDV